MSDITAVEEGGEPGLVRSIGLLEMTLYGAGSMLGAGIYGLIGKAAGQLGSAVWLGFLAAMAAALLTGLSYAALGSRYPRAGGAAYVTHRAYGRPLLTHVVGILVCCSGLTSIAAGARVIAANLQRAPLLSEAPEVLLAGLFILLLAAVVHRGIRESMWANVACTMVEAGGLLLVILAGMRFWGDAPLLEFPHPADGAPAVLPIALVLQGAVLTFYSFIGFEDTLNVAEEVKNPRRTLPLGLIMAMAIACILYVGVSITAVSVIPWQDLATSGAPLADVMAKAAPWFPTWAFIVITIFAVANTGLINFITASRLLYGMARDGRLPAPLAKVHKKRRTPYVATLVLLVVLLALVLAGDISELASSTVLLLLLVFVLINIALVVLKLRGGEEKGGFDPPIWIPALGAVACSILFVMRMFSGDWKAPIIAGALVLLSAALYPLARRGAASE